MYTFDYDLFLWLNFDGGAVIDSVMKAISTPAVWAWLYLLILYMVWRKSGWRQTLLFLAMVGAAVGLSDMIAGIFKHTGLLGDVWPSFPVRLRPMHSEGLDFATNGYYTSYVNGTVSAHTATIVAITIIGIYAVARRWFTPLMIFVAILICYSRIYLACHFPQDILLGALLGAVAGLCGVWMFRGVIRITTKTR